MTIKGWAIFGIVTACVIVFTAVAFLFVNENMARSKKRIFTSLGVVANPQGKNPQRRYQQKEPGPISGERFPPLGQGPV